MSKFGTCHDMSNLLTDPIFFSFIHIIGFCFFPNCDNKLSNRFRNGSLTIHRCNASMHQWALHHRPLLLTQIRYWCLLTQIGYWYLLTQIRSSHWRHNDHDGVSNHQPHGCLLNRLFRRRSKKTSKLRVTGLCAGNSPGPVNSPHNGPVTWKMFPFVDVIMYW